MFPCCFFKCVHRRKAKLSLHLSSYGSENEFVSLTFHISFFLKTNRMKQLETFPTQPPKLEFLIVLGIVTSHHIESDLNFLMISQ